MGMYLNPGNVAFEGIISSKYVDKSRLIDYTNRIIGTPQKLVCFTKPRRFGKSYSAKMLCAYYGKGDDSHGLFNGLKLEKDVYYDKYMNAFNVIYLDITSFMSDNDVIDEKYNNLLDTIVVKIKKDLFREFNFVNSEDNLTEILLDISQRKKEKFVFIIDEWDAIFRELPDRVDIQERYIDFLRSLFKNGNFTDSVVALAYMTGILPIKKYGNQSAISDFNEFTMTNCGELEEYIGFNIDEVVDLIDDSQFEITELQEWYDGYRSPKGKRIFNPNSIIQALERRQLDTYWINTETYKQLNKYIEMDFDGLREDIIKMLGDEKIPVNVNLFQNDMLIRDKNDVYALLIHLGYLTYDYDDKSVQIPNMEIKHEFKNAISASKKQKLMSIIKNSEELLNATYSMDGEKVARIIEEVHDIWANPKSYKTEEALRSVVKTAYISAIDDYAKIEELASGNGFIDIAYLPKVELSKPALLIELKWNKSANGALAQIYEKKYPTIFQNYRSTVLAVAINYSEKTKTHTCKIEKICM